MTRIVGGRSLRKYTTLPFAARVEGLVLFAIKNILPGCTRRVVNIPSGESTSLSVPIDPCTSFIATPLASRYVLFFYGSRSSLSAHMLVSLALMPAPLPG